MRVGFIGLGSQGAPENIADRRRIRDDAVGAAPRIGRTVRGYGRDPWLPAGLAAAGDLVAACA